MRILITLLLFIFSCSSFADVKPLPAEQAFTVQAHVQDPNTLQLQWRMPSGYFLYRDRLHLTVTTPEQLMLGALKLPKGKMKSDRGFGTFQIYRNQFNVLVSVLGQQAGQGQLKLEYQGCTDSGFCYPPVAKNIVVNFDDALALREVSIQAIDESAESQTSWLDGKQLLASHHIVLAVIAFWILGLLLSFTPCILPMIPVLSGIIVGHGDSLTTRKAFLLSLTYVLGMSVTYACVGVVIALLGANLQAFMQNSWVIVSFAAVFVLLAFSMFGFFDLSLPTSIQARFAKLSQGTEGGSYFGVAIMGALSTLILSPCVTPPLVGVLSYVANTGNVFFGAIALFFLSLGMGTPLLFIGTSAGRWLPKAGMWMVGVKNVIGVFLLVVAILLVARILPGPVTLFLWASLLIVSGVYLLKRSIGLLPWLQQGLGVLLLGYGLLCLVGAGLGHDDVLKPLVGLNISTNETTHTTVSTPEALQAALHKAQGQIVLLDFYADWCLSCKILERSVLQDPEIKAALNSIQVLRVDITQNDAHTKALMHQYGVIAPPTLIWLDRAGLPIPAYTLVGEVDKNSFLKTLQKIKER